MCCHAHPVVCVLSTELVGMIGWEVVWVGEGGGCLDLAVNVTGHWELFVGVVGNYLSCFYAFSQQYRLIPAPSSHQGLWALIRIVGTRDPCMQQRVEIILPIHTMKKIIDFI